MVFGMKVIVAEMICVSMFAVHNGVNGKSGKEFVLGFMQNIGRRPSPGKDSIYLTSQEKNAYATIEIPFLNKTITKPLRPNLTTTIDLLPATRMTRNAEQRKGIRITSNKDINVYGANWSNKSSDGFLGLPVSSLGTNYRVVSYTVGSNKQSQFMVVATANDTRVTIQTKNKIKFNFKEFEGGKKITVILNDLDSVQFGGVTDSSGTGISSDKPVAVFSGVNCASVPSGQGFCDHLVEQLPPVDQWGCKFISSPLAQRSRGDLLRILAAYDNTHVRNEWNGGWADFNLHADQYRDELFQPGTSCKISCSKPCFVVQYCKGDPDQSSHTSPDPFMMIVPPVSQYQRQYDLAVPQPQHASYNTYVSIVIQSKETYGLMIDNAPSVISWTRIANTSFSWGFFTTKNDYHSLRHKTAPFYASVYGYSEYEAYGFPAGWAGNENKCGKDGKDTDFNVQVPTRKTLDDEGRHDLGDAWIKVVLHMKAEEWNSPKFRTSVAKAFNEECHKDYANSHCKGLPSYKQQGEDKTIVIDPKNILIRDEPKEFSNLLLEVEMRVQFNLSSPRKTLVLSEEDLVGLLQDTAPLIAKHLGGIDILFVNGKPLPETVELKSPKPIREEISMTTVIGITIATLGCVTGFAVMILFFKRLKDKRSRPRSPYERVSIRYGPRYQSPRTPPLELLPKMGILPSRVPTNLQSERSRMMIPQEALYAEGHIALGYASLRKGAVMPNGYAKLDRKTMRVDEQTLPDQVYTIPALKLPTDNCQSSFGTNSKPEAKSLLQPSCEGSASNTGFLLDLKLHTYTNIPSSSLLQPGPQYSRPLSAAGSEKSTDNMYLEVIDDHSSLAGLP